MREQGRSRNHSHEAAIMNWRSKSVVIVLFAAVGCAGAQQPLKDAFKGYFLIGAAVNRAQFTEQDTRGVNIIKTQFHSITPENVLKWESVHPRLGVYEFSGPDQY